MRWGQCGGFTENSTFLFTSTQYLENPQIYLPLANVSQITIPIRNSKAISARTESVDVVLRPRFHKGHIILSHSRSELYWLTAWNTSVKDTSFRDSTSHFAFIGILIMMNLYSPQRSLLPSNIIQINYKRARLITWEVRFFSLLSKLSYGFSKEVDQAWRTF